MGGTMSDMTCCARDLGLSSDLELAKVAAATPLHHGKGVTAGLLVWSSELRVVLAAQPQSLQREEEKKWDLEDLQPKVGSISSSELSTASSKVVAYDLWSAEPAWTASTPVEEILCMAWVPERRLLVCGGAGIKEIAALDEKHQVVWSLDSGIGKACCLQWAPGLDLMICGGKQEVLAFSLDEAANSSSSWEPRWLVNTEFLSLNCLAWSGSQGLIFAAGSHERVILGKVVALDAKQGGQERWSALPSVGAVLCCLAAEEPALFFCGGNHAKVAALEPGSGEQRWIVDPGVGESRQYGVYSSPGVLCLAWAKASGKLLCGGSLGKIAALDPLSGHLLWAVDPGVSALRSMAYVPEMGGTLCCGAAGGVAALVT